MVVTSNVFNKSYAESYGVDPLVPFKLGEHLEEDTPEVLVVFVVEDNQKLETEAAFFIHINSWWC